VMHLLRNGKYDDATEIYWQLHRREGSVKV
jgi:hypothetical protein